MCQRHLEFYPFLLWTLIVLRSVHCSTESSYVFGARADFPISGAKEEAEQTEITSTISPILHGVGKTPGNERSQKEGKVLPPQITASLQPTKAAAGALADSQRGAGVGSGDSGSGVEGKREGSSNPFVKRCTNPFSDEVDDGDDIFGTLDSVPCKSPPQLSSLAPMPLPSSPPMSPRARMVALSSPGVVPPVATSKSTTLSREQWRIRRQRARGKGEEENIAGERGDITGTLESTPCKSPPQISSLAPMPLPSSPPISPRSLMVALSSPGVVPPGAASKSTTLSREQWQTRRQRARCKGEEEIPAGGDSASTLVSGAEDVEGKDEGLHATRSQQVDSEKTDVKHRPSADVTLPAPALAEAGRAGTEDGAGVDVPKLIVFYSGGVSPSRVCKEGGAVQTPSATLTKSKTKGKMLSRLLNQSPPRSCQLNQAREGMSLTPTQSISQMKTSRLIP